MVAVTPRAWTTRKGQSRKGFQVDWYDAKGERHRKLFSGGDARRKAHDLRIALESAARAGAAGAGSAELPAAMTVRQAGERWVRYVERELRRERTTWEGYEQQLADHVCAAIIEHEGALVPFGDLAAARVTAPLCESLKDALLKKLSPKMAARMVIVARMLFNDVVRRGERVDNPLRAVKVRMQKRGEDEIDILEADDAKALIAAVTTLPPKPPTFAEFWIVLTMLSGLRPSENRGLAIEDLALDGPTPGLHVRRRADLWGCLGPVKTANGRRFVPLPPKAVALAKRWLISVPRKKIDRKGNLLWDGVSDPENRERRLHLVFPTADATVQSLANVYNRVWVPAMIRAGLVDWVPALDKAGKPKRDAEGNELRRAKPRYRVNSLRHFNASLLIAEGWNPKTIQCRLGHGSIQVTFDLYGHLFKKREADQDAIAAIEKKLLG